MLHILGHTLKHTLEHAAGLLPFLFLTYLAMELLEHFAGAKFYRKMKHAGAFGPMWGALLGVLPQCGFSAAAASFYAGRVIGVGTLMAVFLSTSDEMLPILVSESVPFSVILKILFIKVVIACMTGFLAEFLYRKFFAEKEKQTDIHTICLEEHCSCEDGILLSALKHTLTIFFYIFVLMFLLNGIIDIIGHDALTGLFSDIPVLGQLIAALVGLIPNCASSVIITQLYLRGVISAGMMMSGLLVNAGIGSLVLIRLNRNMKQNAVIIGAMYGFSVLWGVLLDVLQITF